MKQQSEVSYILKAISFLVLILGLFSSLLFIYKGFHNADMYRFNEQVNYYLQYGVLGVFYTLSVSLTFINLCKWLNYGTGYIKTFKKGTFKIANFVSLVSIIYLFSFILYDKFKYHISYRDMSSFLMIISFILPIVVCLLINICINFSLKNITETSPKTGVIRLLKLVLSCLILGSILIMGVLIYKYDRVSTSIRYDKSIIFVLYFIMCCYIICFSIYYLLKYLIGDIKTNKLFNLHPTLTLFLTITIPFTFVFIAGNGDDGAIFLLSILITMPITLPLALSGFTTMIIKEIHML